MREEVYPTSTLSRREILPLTPGARQHNCVPEKYWYSQCHDDVACTEYLDECRRRQTSSLSLANHSWRGLELGKPKDASQLDERKFLAILLGDPF